MNAKDLTPKTPWIEATNATIDKSTGETYADLGRDAALGTKHDDYNAAFILNSTATTLLQQIARGEIDLQTLAKVTLIGRHQAW